MSEDGGVKGSQGPDTLTAKRLSLVEVLLTIGGFMSIFVAIEPELSKTVYPAFSVLLVMFIILALRVFTYLRFGGIDSWQYRFSAGLLGLTFSTMILYVIVTPSLLVFLGPSLAWVSHTFSDSSTLTVLAAGIMIVVAYGVALIGFYWAVAWHITGLLRDEKKKPKVKA